jgi:hypothetical protein
MNTRPAARASVPAAAMTVPRRSGRPGWPLAVPARCTRSCFVPGCAYLSRQKILWPARSGRLRRIASRTSPGQPLLGVCGPAHEKLRILAAEQPYPAGAPATGVWSNTIYSAQTGAYRGVGRRYRRRHRTCLAALRRLNQLRRAPGSPAPGVSLLAVQAPSSSARAGEPVIRAATSWPRPRISASACRQCAAKHSSPIGERMVRAQ